MHLPDPATAHLPSEDALPALPQVIQVELTNICRMGCPSCARHHWDEAANAPGQMGVATLDALQPLLEAAREVVVGGYGDPSEGELTPALIRRAKAAGSSVRLITGGSNLAPPRLDELIEAGLDRLVLSMDGATDATLRELRGVPLSAWLRWIRQARKQREAGGQNRPLVQLNFVAQWGNVEELPALVELCAREGVAGIHAAHLKAYTPATFDRCLLSDPEAARPWFDAARVRAAQLGVFLHLPPLDPAPRTCRQPFELLFVRHDGSVRGCCSATFEPPTRGLFAGRLGESSAAELWRSAAQVGYRDAARRGDELPPPCRQCAFRLPTLAAHRRPLRSP